MEEFFAGKITAYGWECSIKIFSYALDIPAPSDDVLKKMSFAEKMLMAKRLQKMIDFDDSEQMKRGEFMTNKLLFNSGS